MRTQVFCSLMDDLFYLALLVFSPSKTYTENSLSVTFDTINTSNKVYKILIFQLKFPIISATKRAKSRLTNTTLAIFLLSGACELYLCFFL